MPETAVSAVFGAKLLAKTKSCVVVGLDGFLVEVEVDISPGLPAFHIVGLPDAAVQESKERPYRSPHYTISSVGLVGGGAIPRPGEITLSHRGVLFLDKLPEFGHASLEVLRQPQEDKVVTMAGRRGP